MAQHRGLRLNTTHTPTHDAQPVDHRRVRVSADERVRKINVLLPNVLREIFEIYLVTDADTRRNYAKTVECLCAPLEKLVTRTIAPELHLHVLLKRVARAREVD